MEFQLSIVRNQLLRMYGVSKLHNLVTLNLANNGILTIEGIKDMINLQTLCLAGNNIKVCRIQTFYTRYHGRGVVYVF